jgi:hypothetical protein
MQILFLLITLTQNGAGDINAAFVNTGTLAQCQQKALMLESVFSASDIPVIESRCIKSDLRFSEFGHASTTSKIRNYYLVSVGEETLQVSAVPDWRSCMKKRKLSGQDKVYCSSSVQSVL